MSGALWSMLEVTTAFIIANIPSLRLVLQNHLPSLAGKVSLNFRGSTPTTEASRKSSKLASSVSTQGNQHGITPAEISEHDSHRMKVFHLDGQGRPKLSSVATFIV